MELLRDYALSFVGTPYLWNGSTPMGGYDCSHFVKELLRSSGIVIPGDPNSQGIFDYFDRVGCVKGAMTMGALSFYGESLSKITHIGMLLDQYRMISSASGDSSTVDLVSAISKGAFIKVRPIKYRPDFLTTLKPNYASIGSI